MTLVMTVSNHRRHVNLVLLVYRTNLQQEAVIKVFGISFGDHCENLIKSTMAANAGKVKAVVFYAVYSNKILFLTFKRIIQYYI